MDHITTHAEDALDRLAEQYRGKPKIKSLLDSLCEQVQSTEDALWQLLTETTVDTAVGDALDVLGKIVGERRDGAADADYRIRVRARIRANLSNGTVEDVLAVLRALLGSSAGAATISWVDRYPAMFEARISGVAIPAGQVMIYVRFIRDSKAGGVGAHFGWQTVPDAQAFTMAVAACLTIAGLIGDTLIQVDTTAGFPSAGILVIEEGEATEETVVYNVRGASSFSGFTLTQPHAVGAAAKLTPSPGLGFGDDTNPATGGAFVGVADVDV